MSNSIIPRAISAQPCKSEPYLKLAESPRVRAAAGGSSRFTSTTGDHRARGGNCGANLSRNACCARWASSRDCEHRKEPRAKIPASWCSALPNLVYFNHDIQPPRELLIFCAESSAPSWSRLYRILLGLEHFLEERWEDKHVRRARRMISQTGARWEHNLRVHAVHVRRGSTRRHTENTEKSIVHYSIAAGAFGIGIIFTETNNKMLFRTPLVVDDLSNICNCCTDIIST